jgi:hypothetical protein
MAAPAVHPENLEEHLIWHSITWTWAFYLIGGLYIVAPALGWILLAWIGLKAYLQGPHTPPRERVRFPLGAKLWVGGMIVMEIALIAGHLDFALGFGQLIKSSIGWAKGWALLAIFVLAGAALQIRPKVVYRAACLLAAQTLILVPLFVVAPQIGLPGNLYVSPLQAVGGPGPEFFAVELYGRDPGSGAPRWRFFTPWAPAAGFVANVYLIFALQEQSRRLKYQGIAASVLMCLMSQSRLALLAMIAVATAGYGLSRLTRSWIMGGVGAAVFAAGIIANNLIEAFMEAKTRFAAARAASSRVRATLGRIALQRWESEAPIWGHGVVERGPHLVEFMPIGSHHSWYGLLFVKGLVGFFALLVPMAWSAVEMIVKAQMSRTARSGLAMMLILFMYSFGENLEILVYLFWPAMVIIGIASRQRVVNPFIAPLSGKRLDKSARTVSA